MNSLLTDTQQGDVKWVVKVNGVIRTAPLAKTLAEAAIANLPIEEQSQAEVVAVTTGGQEILLG